MKKSFWVLTQVLFWLIVITIRYNNAKIETVASTATASTTQNTVENGEKQIYTASGSVSISVQ
jgi:hypothetical protein